MGKKPTFVGTPSNSSPSYRKEVHLLNGRNEWKLRG